MEITIKSLKGPQECGTSKEKFSATPPKIFIASFSYRKNEARSTLNT